MYIARPQRVQIDAQDVGRAIDGLIQPVDSLVRQNNLYIPAIHNYQMGTCTATAVAVGTFTPFVTAGLPTVYADSEDTSVIEIHLIYYSGTASFSLRLRENYASNPLVLYQQELPNSGIVTSRAFVVTTFGVGQRVARTCVPYVLEVAPIGVAANFGLAANLKVVRGVSA